jgi:hypothetical protein
MKITLSELYKAIKEQADYVNFNNTIHSLEYCKTEIEFKEKEYMKTSEFKAELEKLGYTFEDERVKNEQNLTVAWISTSDVNTIDSNYGYEVSPKPFSLIYKYATTPIAEREDEKLFNVQIVKGNWGCAPWLYRNAVDEISTSFSEANNFLNQQWTLEQIKEYGIDDETVYKRVPVED